MFVGKIIRNASKTGLIPQFSTINTGKISQRKKKEWQVGSCKTKVSDEATEIGRGNLRVAQIKMCSGIIVLS